MLRGIKALIPHSFQQRARDWIRRAFVDHGSKAVLSNLCQPWSDGQHALFYFHDPSRLIQNRSANELPVPPSNRRMGYATQSDYLYLEIGEKSVSWLRSIMKDHQIEIGAGDAAMEWGCATGRVLRWFAEEAKHSEFWGVDQHGESIAWAKQNLAPPFQFMTCCAYPHLPFEDNKFKFVYGISVFTHIEHLQDMWLMEMNRIMKPKGFAVFTIHDEHTVQWFQDNGKPRWIPNELELSSILEHEMTVITQQWWGATYTFFRTEWIQREWGQYFDVLEIKPYAEDYQSAVVLQKR
jgi:ubiquinone/menaquinone biosynthesis C-methylase UbiE